MHAVNLDIGLAARVIAGIRSHTARHTGCPEWDTPGIAKALTQTPGAPGDVLAAAAIAAQDVNLAKPSVKGFQVCWPVKASEPPQVSHNRPCPEHPDQPQPCRTCKTLLRRGQPEDIARCRDALDTARREQHEQAARRATP